MLIMIVSPAANALHKLELELEACPSGYLSTRPGGPLRQYSIGSLAILQVGARACVATCRRRVRVGTQAQASPRILGSGCQADSESPESKP